MDDPPTRPQSPDFEENLPQRITAPLKDEKKPVTYKRSNESMKRAESPVFGLDFPARITNVPSKEARKNTTFKKSIFKSRAKPVIEDPPPPVAISSPRSPEPPRVPPINPPHISPTPPDSTSLSDFDSMELDFPSRKAQDVVKPKKQFFKSRNKLPCESASLQSEEIPVKVSREYEPSALASTSDYDFSQPTPSLRSP